MHLLDERLMRETKAIRRRKAYRAGDNKFNWNDGPGHFIWNYRIEPKEIGRDRKERRKREYLAISFLFESQPRLGMNPRPLCEFCDWYMFK